MSRITFIALVVTSCAFAQTASITGRVTDPNGGVIPGVQVIAQSRDSGIATEARTNQDGYYSLSSLQPGSYDLSLSKPGFAMFRQEGLQLEVQQAARIDIALRIGAMTERVEVTADAPLIESQNATMGAVIPASQVAELPLLGRNPYALAMLVPGVRPARRRQQPAHRSDQHGVLLRSTDSAHRPTSSCWTARPTPRPRRISRWSMRRPDLVQEFKVETNNFSAEYGRASGGVFNVITKSGTNQYHGTLYEFFRNDKLNANDFFANNAGAPRPPFKYNQFGGTVGGPVTIPHVYNGHNKTFFFLSIEDVRFIQGDVFVGTLPTTRQLSGDFTQTRNAAGNLITIYDPATTTPNPDGLRLHAHGVSRQHHSRPPASIR